MPPRSPRSLCAYLSPTETSTSPSQRPVNALAVSEQIPHGYISASAGPLCKPRPAGNRLASSRCPAPRWLGRWLECCERNGRSHQARHVLSRAITSRRTGLYQRQKPQGSRDRCCWQQTGVKTVGQQPGCHSQGRRTWRICGLGAKFFKERLALHIVRPSFGNAARPIVKVDASGRYAKSQR
ncbi:hypothetical protein CABS01_13931 [Colletotrichum abscissum]|uniref:uncharacterized protein n=1 Tax=Colletotrichum abscissum TaxID=1671311 RepID=UPI0027D70E78|nr:uncharacterized protein CABS01_13931 [Colletotrichum abscissum]KAK1483779.1 hypothetical protein CABS01_13931 [Colletotrichum abscissum]